MVPRTAWRPGPVPLSPLPSAGSNILTGNHGNPNGNLVNGLKNIPSIYSSRVSIKSCFTPLSRYAEYERVSQWPVWFKVDSPPPPVFKAVGWFPLHPGWRNLTSNQKADGEPVRPLRPSFFGFYNISILLGQPRPGHARDQILVPCILNSCY